jgi:predicted methyltransferase
MAKARRHDSLAYRLELLVIRLRDLVRSPAKVLLEAGARPGMIVLDFGCGPGGFSLAAAEIVGPKGRVYALDIHALALEAVRRATARRRVDNVQPVPASRIADVPGESIDMVLVYDVLHIDPQPDSAQEMLSAIHRLLKPKGVLSVGDHHLKEARLLRMVTGGSLFRLVARNRRTLQFAKADAREVTT